MSNKNLDLCVVFILKKAYKTYIKEKCGFCARAVRLAIEYGFNIKLERHEAANDYGSSLIKAGFSNYFSYPSQPKNTYTPIKGDVAIIKYSPYGHICMFTGDCWVSDFIQLDMYGGHVRDKDPEFHIYRFK